MFTLTAFPFCSILKNSLHTAFTEFDLKIKQHAVNNANDFYPARVSETADNITQCTCIVFLRIL